MTRKAAIRILRKGAPFSELYDEAWENALTMAIDSLKTEMRDCNECKSHMAFLMAKMAYDDRHNEPIKHGWWQHYEGTLTCSVCHTEIYDDIMELLGDDVPRYCPNCGADMREVEE